MKFRNIPKKTLQAKVPAELLDRVGHAAVKYGRPDNEVVSRLLCLGLGIDPAKYGINAAQPAASN